LIGRCYKYLAPTALQNIPSLRNVKLRFQSASTNIEVIPNVQFVMLNEVKCRLAPVRRSASAHKYGIPTYKTFGRDIHFSNRTSGFFSRPSAQTTDGLLQNDISFLSGQPLRQLMFSATTMSPHEAVLRSNEFTIIIIIFFLVSNI
jgi:hypothetical protein